MKRLVLNFNDLLPALKHFFTEKRVTVIVMITLMFGLSCYMLKNAKTYPYGDGIEYLMMTEALYNHGSVDIKSNDIKGYIEWTNKRGIVDNKNSDLAQVYKYSLVVDSGKINFSPKKIQGSYGFILGRHNNIYSQHFWFYSTLAVPVRIVLGLVHGDLTQTFLITNLWLLFLAVFLVLRESRLFYWQRLTLSFFMVFSSAIWYLAWTHVELFAGIWVFLGMVYFFVDRKLLSIFILCIVSMHFPPLAFLALFIIFVVLYERRKKWTFSLFAKLFLVSFWVIIPTVYNLIVFETTNIIMKAGYLSWDVVSWNRFIGFFFDVNQGMVLGAPLILLVFFIFLVKDVIKRDFWIGYGLVSTVVIMSLFFMQMENWNHGQAVVNRYAVWTTSIIAVVVLFRIFKLNNKWMEGIILFLMAFSQAYIIPIQYDYTKLKWYANEMTPLGSFILTNYPSYYNPDPNIFTNRINPLNVSTTDSVFVYSTKSGAITKMMLRPKSYRQLLERGMDSAKLFSYMSHVHKFYDNWFYISKKDFKDLDYVQSKDTLINFINRQNEIILYNRFKEQILNDSTWYNSIVEGARKANISVDKMIDNNVEYLIWETKSN